MSDGRRRPRQADVLQNLTHELSTPLTPILGYLRLLDNPQVGPLNPMQRRAVKSMQACAGRLQGVIDDLLVISRLESGQFAIQRKPIEIDEIVTSVLDELAPRAEDQHVALERSLPKRDAPVRADPDKVAIALRHLVGNALKFTGEGGRVYVALDHPPGRVRIRVWDSGLGIPADEVEAVFEPFYQVDASATRRFGGLGIGLAIARRIADAHGGSLTAESPPSVQPEGHFLKGSLFVLELPENP